MPTSEQDVARIIIMLVSGQAQWEGFSEDVQNAILRHIGLDPSGDISPRMLQTAAQTYLAGKATDFASAGGAPEPIFPNIPQLGGVEPNVMAEALGQLHFSLWGEPPSDKWLSDRLDSGMNLFEVERDERQKPAFMHTRTARDETAGFAAQLGTALGLR